MRICPKLLPLFIVLKLLFIKGNNLHLQSIKLVKLQDITSTDKIIRRIIIELLSSLYHHHHHHHHDLMMIIIILLLMMMMMMIMMRR